MKHSYFERLFFHGLLRKIHDISMTFNRWFYIKKHKQPWIVYDSARAVTPPSAPWRQGIASRERGAGSAKRRDHPRHGRLKHRGRQGILGI